MSSVGNAHTTLAVSVAPTHPAPFAYVHAGSAANVAHLVLIGDIGSDSELYIAIHSKVPTLSRCTDCRASVIDIAVVLFIWSLPVALIYTTLVATVLTI